MALLPHSSPWLAGSPHHPNAREKQLLLTTLVLTYHQHLFSAVDEKSSIHP